MSNASDSRGFTLLEVTVALAIVGLVLAGAFTAAAAGLRASRAAADAVEAASLAEHLLARIETFTAAEFSVLYDGEEGGIDPPFDRYRWRAEARPLEPGLVEVRLTLLWPNGALAVDTRLRDPTTRDAERSAP